MCGYLRRASVGPREKWRRSQSIRVYAKQAVPKRRDSNSVNPAECDRSFQKSIDSFNYLIDQVGGIQFSKIGKQRSLTTDLDRSNFVALIIKKCRTHT